MAYQYSLRKAQERREEKRREDEFQRNELASYHNRHKFLQTAAEREKLVAAGAEQVGLWQELQEQQVSEDLRKAEEQRFALRAAAVRADQLASARETAEVNAVREAKHRQHIIEGSSELRDLQRLIQAARVKVERDKQRTEQGAAATTQHQKDLEFSRLRKAEQAEAQAQQQAEEVRSRIKAWRYRNGLDLQLQYHQLTQQEAKDQLEQERAVADAAARRELEQEAGEQLKRIAKQQQAQAFILEHQRERRAALLNRELDAAVEDSRIQAFEEQQRQRDAEAAAKEAAKRALANRRYEGLKNQLEAEQRAADEDQRLIDLLRAEQLEEAAAAAAERSRAALRESQARMAEANREQLRLKAERAAAEKAEEERYRQQLMAQFAEQDKLEQMSAQKRRLRLEEHKREAARLVAVKQAAVAAAKEREEAERAAAEAAERASKAIVRQERERLLAEAGDLLKYLPHSVLVGKESLPPLMPAYLD